jgi:hypothetical protein
MKTPKATNVTAAMSGDDMTANPAVSTAASLSANDGKPSPQSSMNLRDNRIDAR